MVEKIIKNDVQLYKVITLSEYKAWAKARQALLASEVDELEDWIVDQKKDVQSMYSEVRYFQGMQNVKKLYEDTWRSNSGKVIYAITDYDKAYKTLNAFLEKEYFPDRIARGVSVKSILSKKSTTGLKDKSREKKLLRQMKQVDILNDLGIEINVYDDKVSLVAFDDKKPEGIMIKNELIAKAFKSIFEYIWNGK